MTLTNLLFGISKSQSCSINKVCKQSITNLRPVQNSTFNEEASRASKKREATSKLTVEGINLHWKKIGKGPNVALLLPGLVGSVKDSFLPVTNKMNLDEFTLIGFDPPGYGYSRPPEREVFTTEFCLAKDARLANSLMKELGYDKYSVIGSSNGGITGALLAAAFPESVDKVVMCNSPLLFNKRSKDIMEIMVDLDSWEPSQQKTLLRTYDKKYLVKMLKDWKKFVDKEAETVEFTKYFTEKMNQVSAPTMFIKSTDDTLIPMEDAEQYGNLIKNFELSEITHGGHDHLEFVDDFVSVTESFLLSE